MEIKNKLSVTREEVGKDNRWKKGKVHQGICIKDTWAKLNQVVLRVTARVGTGVGHGGVKMETTVIEQQ